MIGSVSDNIVRDTDGRELCPACLDLDPCACGASVDVRATCYALRYRVSNQLAGLERVIAATQRRSWWSLWWQTWWRA